MKDPSRINVLQERLKKLNNKDDLEAIADEAIADEDAPIDLTGPTRKSKYKVRYGKTKNIKEEKWEEKFLKRLQQVISYTGPSS